MTCNMTLEKLWKRNEELEAEVRALRTQLATERIISASRLTTRAIDVGVIEKLLERIEQAEAALAAMTRERDIQSERARMMTENVQSLSATMARLRAAIEMFCKGMGSEHTLRAALADERQEPKS